MSGGCTTGDVETFFDDFLTFPPPLVLLCLTDVNPTPSKFNVSFQSKTKQNDFDFAKRLRATSFF